jgi:hypothetical protein
VLNKQKKRFKGFLILLFKGFVAFISVTIVYKGFSINIKLKLKLVTKEILI